MAEQKIVITIDENGSVHAKTDGFQGSDCLDALDELLELDGMVSDMKKPMNTNRKVTFVSAENCGLVKNECSC
jgi:hypothetical protein